MRVDVREMTEAAARAERQHNQTEIVLFSSQLVEGLGEWSVPMQIRCERLPNGLTEVFCRTLEPDVSA